MTVTMLTRREFDQDISGSMRAAAHGPVFITDLGKPAYVLLTMGDYQALTEQQNNIIDMLAMPEVGDIEFEIPVRLGKNE